MQMMKLGMALVLSLCSVSSLAAVDLGQFIRKDDFNDIKLSPTGKYYAATVPLEDKTALVIFTREGNKQSGVFMGGRNTHVNGFEWVKEERVLVSIAEKYGMLDQPRPTGDWSGSNPGDFYLFDTQAKKLQYLLAAGSWIDPDKAAVVEPFSFTSRDGLEIHGYLTQPRGVSGPQPMVLMPYGGPYGIFDEWHYDRDAQMLATAGYTVMQVNYRGSGNYGWEFRRVGALQWGGTMQDDLTDATRWAIREGQADAKKSVFMVPATALTPR